MSIKKLAVLQISEHNQGTVLFTCIRVKSLPFGKSHARYLKSLADFLNSKGYSLKQLSVFSLVPRVEILGRHGAELKAGLPAKFL